MTAVNLLALMGAGVVLGAATSGAAMALVQEGDSEVTSRAVLTQEITASQCVTAVPAESRAALGITGDPALTARNTCTVMSGQRELTVSFRSLLSGGSAADLEVAARQAFDLACGFLGEDNAVLESNPDWIPGRTTCVRTPVGGKGLSELVMLTNDNNIIEMRVFNLDLADVTKLQQGLSGLSAASEVVL